MGHNISLRGHKRIFNNLQSFCWTKLCFQTFVKSVPFYILLQCLNWCTRSNQIHTLINISPLNVGLVFMSENLPMFNKVKTIPGSISWSSLQENVMGLSLGQAPPPPHNLCCGGSSSSRKLTLLEFVWTLMRSGCDLALFEGVSWEPLKGSFTLAAQILSPTRFSLSWNLHPSDVW